MFTFIAGLALAVNLGPMAPDAPAHEPQMAASGSTVAMAFGAGKGIYFSRSTDAGKTFSAPVKVAEAEIVPLTRHRGPRIAFRGQQNRGHRGGRQDAGRRSPRAWPAVRRRPDRVELGRWRRELVEGSCGQRSTGCFHRGPAFSDVRWEGNPVCYVAR